MVPYVQQMWKGVDNNPLSNAHVSKHFNAVSNKYPLSPAVQCPHIDLVQYWHNSSAKDWAFRTEFMKVEDERRSKRLNLPLNTDRLFQYYNTDEKYVTFEPDHGGWNNIRYFEVLLCELWLLCVIHI